MFSKITLAFAGLFTFVTADVLPGTFIISVVDSSGTTLGTLNGYGNFSSPGPSYPFTTSATSGGYSELSGYDLCSVSGTPALLACYDNSASAVAQFDSLNGDLTYIDTDGTWSVEDTTGASGGTTPIGLPYGIPVYYEVPGVHCRHPSYSRG